jgi:hypothetical protein
MRILVVLALISGGCSKLLGISDPIADGADARRGDGAGDPDSSPDDLGPCTPGPGFAAPVAYPLSGTPGLMTTGDFDGDTFQDVAVALGTKILILHGDGSGKLGRTQEIGFAADGLIGGDFDGDGLDDLILWKVGGQSVILRRQDPQHLGAFLEAQPLPASFMHVQQVKAGLLDDGNHVPDLIIQDDVELRVYTADLLFPGTFDKEDLIGMTGDRVIQLADFNNEGKDDIAFLTTDGKVEIAPQVMGTKFGPPAAIATAASSVAAGFGHFGSAATFDLIVATPAGGTMFHQTALGALTTFASQDGAIAGVTGALLEVVDVDGDSRDDIIVGPGIIRQASAGTFAPLAACPMKSSTLFRDLDKNGKPDLLRIVGSTLEVRVQ